MEYSARDTPKARAGWFFYCRKCQFVGTVDDEEMIFLRAGRWNIKQER